MADSDLNRLPREVLEALVERSPMMIAVLDAGGRITWANPELARALGAPRAELIDTSFVSRCLEADDREHARRLLAGGQGTWTPCSMRRDDGGAIQAAWLAVRLAGDAVAVMGRDVSEERDLAARLARAQRLEAIGRLAGGIAHDFNNLLTVIGGNAQLLVELRELTGPAYDEAEEIARAADTARAVVRQLLTFTGRAPQPARPVDVNDRIENLREIVHRLIDAPVRIDFDLTPGLPPVRLEEGQIEQVVINLLLNARDAMPRGGRIEVRTGLREVVSDGTPLPPGAPAPGRYVELVVADSGQGMEPETLQRILEPFFTTRASAGGTGLGLPTVHAIVQQAGGTLDIASAPGQGSTFTIRLPVAAAEQPAPAGEAGMPPPVPPAVVLVVDDHEAIRALCRRTLENDGHRVIEAASLEAAIEAAGAADRLDLIVADARLRGEGGRELLLAVRGARPALRALLMSDHPHVRDYDGAVLEKPFTAAALVAAVRQVLS